jgi:hypothetical protein
MADKNKKQNGKKKGGGKLIFFMMLTGCFLPFGTPTLLVALGLLPTLVTFLTDADENRSATATIGLMNVAGVFPYFLDLWDKGQTMEVALAIVRNPTNWLVMLGSAAIGQLLLYTIPPLIATMTVAQYEARVKALKEAQEELKKIWGPDVTNVLSIDDVRKKG